MVPLLIDIKYHYHIYCINLVPVYPVLSASKWANSIKKKKTQGN